MAVTIVPATFMTLERHPQVRPLNTLRVGEKGRIVKMTLPPDQGGRLLEMGLTVGSVLEVIRFAPFGDPMEIKVRGYRLSLRKREAAEIHTAAA